MHIIDRTDRISSKYSTSLLAFEWIRSALLPWRLRALILLCCITWPGIGSADLLVVTRVDTTISNLDEEQLSGLWLGKFSRIGDISLEVIDVNEKHPLRATLYEDVLGMSDRQVKSYWAIMVFRGNGFPPRMVENEADVRKWVLESPNRIGYVSTTDGNPQLKVLFTLEIETGDQ